MYLASETAQLVLSYMLDQSPSLPLTITSFLGECPHLPTMDLGHCEVGGRTLCDILKEFTVMVDMVLDKAKDLGMLDGYHKPVTSVLEWLLSMISSADTSAVIQTSDISVQTEEPLTLCLTPLTSTRNFSGAKLGSCARYSKIAPRDSSAESKILKPKLKHTRVSEVKPLQIKRCSQNYFLSGPTRKSVKPNPPPTRSLSRAQAQSYLLQNYRPTKLNFSPSGQFEKNTSFKIYDESTVYKMIPPVLLHCQDQVQIDGLDFDQLKSEEDFLVRDMPVLWEDSTQSPINLTLETPDNNKRLNFPSSVGNSAQEQFPPKSGLKIRDSFSLFGDQPLDLSNNNVNTVLKSSDSVIDSKAIMTSTNSKSINTIIPINSETMFLISSCNNLTDEIKFEPSDPGNSLGLIDSSDVLSQTFRDFTGPDTVLTSPEEVVCCPDTLAGLVMSSETASTPRERRMRRTKTKCRKCPGCVRKDCGACRNCQDKPRFGGPNKRRRPCDLKTCTGVIDARAGGEVDEETPNIIGKKPRKITRKKGVKLRHSRCKECEGCRRPDCGTCKHCSDKVKFGGEGILKQACLFKVCQNIVKCAPHPVNKTRNKLSIKETEENIKKIWKMRINLRNQFKPLKVKFCPVELLMEDLTQNENNDLSQSDSDNKDKSFEDISTRGRKRKFKARFLDFFESSKS